MIATHVIRARHVVVMPHCSGVVRRSALCLSQRAYYDKIQAERNERDPDTPRVAEGKATYSAAQHTNGSEDRSDTAPRTSKTRKFAVTNNAVIESAEKINMFFSLWLAALIAWGIYMCSEFDERPLRERA